MFMPMNAMAGPVAVLDAAAFIASPCERESIAAARGRKMRLVKGFTPLIRFLGLFTGLVNKAVGNLTYDKSLSYPDFKPEFGLEESIVLSET